MARNEDYLDSLLDSVNNSAKEPDISDGLEDLKSILQSDSDYLNDEENDSLELENFDSSSSRNVKPQKTDRDPFIDPFADSSNEDLEFLREFEKDMGIYDSDDEVFSGLESDSEKTFEDSTPASVKSEPNDSEDILSDILGEDFNNSDEYGAIDLSDAKAEEDPLLDGLTDILNEADDEAKDDSIMTDAGDESVMTDAGEDVVGGSGEEEPNGSDSADASSDVSNEETAEPDIISDVEDDPDIEDPTEGVIEGPVDSETETSGSGDDEEGSISEEEIMDIGNLLDSIDEEGNVNMPEGGSGVAVDENGNADSVSVAEGTPIDEEKTEEKQGIFKKILGMLFKKKDKSDEPEEEYSEYDFDEVIIPEEELQAKNLSKEEKKAAKAAEKEAKKKEKEEAKKKAAEEKAAKKKDKPVKEKKPKTKLVDNSPKIPIKVLIPFVLLSVSLVVLWNVAKNTISLELQFNSAKKAFDKQNYMDAYSKLSGMDVVDEEDLILVDRARLMATLEMRYKSYEMYYAEGKHIYAIDNLVRGAVFFADHEREATEVGIPSEFDALGRQILVALSDTYGIDAGRADELVEIRDRAEYTKELYHALEDVGLWSLED